MRLRRVLVMMMCVVVPAAVGLAADDGRIEIGPTDTYPIVISGPGSYILTADLEVVDENVNAIEIHNPQSVTLDLGGHAIRGPCAGTGYGITVPDGLTVSAVRVRNGTVSCFYWGVDLVSTWNHGGVIIDNVSATDNLHNGIYATQAVIQECNASGNGGSGVSASGSVIRGCVASRNGGHGIYSGGSGLVHGCVASSNGDDGIYLTSTGNQVALCSVWGNSGYGINMYANAHNNVSHSAGSDNDAGNIVNCGVGNGCHHNMMP